VVAYRVAARSGLHAVNQTLRPRTIRELNGDRAGYFSAIWQGLHWHVIARVAPPAGARSWRTSDEELVG